MYAFGNVTTQMPAYLQKKREYMLVNTIERDARNDGWKAGLVQGKSLGLAEGEARGRSEGSRQKALETAKILKQLGDSVQKIVQATGLTQAEVEAIN